MNRDHWDSYVADLSFDIYQAAMQDQEDTEKAENEGEGQANETR